jgi:hypothetical protein
MKWEWEKDRQLGVCVYFIDMFAYLESNSLSL